MAKAKSAADRIAELEAEIQKIKDDEAKATVDLANDKLTALQEALEEFNKAAKETGGRVRARRLITDAETVTPSAGGKGGKRLRLNDEKLAEISDKVVKAVRAHHKEGGASRADIMTYLKGNGYENGTHYNEGHLGKIIGGLIGKSIRKEGDKSTTKYFLAAA